MEIDLDQIINDADGNPRWHVVPKTLNGIPILDARGMPEYESKGELKLKDVLYEAVNATYQGEDPKPEQIYERGMMARMIRGGGKTKFTADEISKVLIPCVVKRCRADPLLAREVVEMLDPDRFKEKAAV